jgi:hypothetical protein
MLDENYALSLARPKVRSNSTLPFSADEMQKILKAAEHRDVDPRVKAFILTVRSSGLRISDVPGCGFLALMECGSPSIRLRLASQYRYCCRNRFRMHGRERRGKTRNFSFGREIPRPLRLRAFGGRESRRRVEVEMGSESISPAFRRRCKPLPSPIGTNGT